MDDEEFLVAASTLRRGATRLSRRMRLARGDGGLTQQQFSVLAHLSRSGPAPRVTWPWRSGSSRSR